jgi:hypothetical protein
MKSEGTMSLTFGLQTPRGLFDKLKRDAALLDEELTSDGFFNFVVTGYSIIDWLKHEPSVPRASTEAMYANRWIKICGDLATAGKHFRLDKRVPITSNTSLRLAGYGIGRYGKMPYGEAEESIQIDLNDGVSVSGFELVKNVVETWETLQTGRKRRSMDSRNGGGETRARRGSMIQDGRNCGNTSRREAFPVRFC